MKSKAFAEKAPHFEIHKCNGCYAMECEAVVHQLQASIDQGISPALFDERVLAL